MARALTTYSLSQEFPMREEKKEEAEADESELAGEGWSKRVVVRRQEKLIKKKEDLTKDGRNTLK